MAFQEPEASQGLDLTLLGALFDDLYAYFPETIAKVSPVCASALNVALDTTIKISM